jgi:type IV secretion system protein VirB4
MLDVAEPIAGFHAPVHRALTEPILLGGAPRSLAIVNGTLAGAIGLGLRLWIAGLASGRSAMRCRSGPRAATRSSSTWPAATSATLFGCSHDELARISATRAPRRLPALGRAGRRRVVLNKDGSFQRTARFRGPDLDSATPAELVATTARLNNALRRSARAGRSSSRRSARPRSTIRKPLSRSGLGAGRFERREQFREEGAHFESRYFLTLLWMPPAEDAARAEGWLYEGRATTGVDPWELLQGFTDRSDRVLNLVEGFVPEVRWLDDAETLTYLHSTISTRRQRVRVPETPMHLDALLADEPLTGGLEPRLGDHHLRTLTIVGFPSVTFPGLLDELNRLAFEYRWSTRAIMLDKTDATKLLTASAANGSPSAKASPRSSRR